MHCGKALYNNLLWKNWSTQRLPLMIIIGNSFNGMKDRFVPSMDDGDNVWEIGAEVTFAVCRLNRAIDREFKQDYRYISQAVDVCEESVLPCPPRLIDVFSDTAVITFPSSSLNKLPQSTWTEPHEPQYQHCPDLEIIQREAVSWERTWTRYGQNCTVFLFYHCHWYTL